jgi:hypothetical protein
MNTTSLTSPATSPQAYSLAGTWPFRLLGVLPLMLAFTLIGQAQVSFSAGSMVAQPTSTIEVPITVANFQGIAGLQLSLAWDPDVLSFTGITNFDLDKQELFDYNEFSPGSLYLLWQANNPDTGFSVEDGHTIFTLQFSVIGQTGDSTWVSFVDEPHEPEVVNFDNQILALEFSFGLIMVDEESSLLFTPESPMTMQIIPNPCREWCDVLLSVRESMDVQIRILDLTGQTVYHIARHLEPGTQEVSLPAVQALASGGYFIMVETRQSRYIKKMLIQK